MKILIKEQKDIIESMKNLRKVYRITQQMLADGI